MFGNNRLKQNHTFSIIYIMRFIDPVRRPS
jgi:hypothetical protein